MKTYWSPSARPVRVPAVPAGTVLTLAADQWRYSYGEALTLTVERVREELSRYYDAEVWIEGYDRAGQWRQALVPIAVLRELAGAGGMEGDPPAGGRPQPISKPGYARIPGSQSRGADERR